jgi:hypothetical protein
VRLKPPAVVLAVVVAVTAPAAVGAPRPLLDAYDVFHHGGGTTVVRSVDPATLDATGPALPLHGFLQGWVHSPGGDQLALGVSDRGRIEVVDARARRTLQQIRTSYRTAWSLLAWPRTRRLLALGSLSGRSSALLVLDPVSGRVLRRRRISGYISATARTRDWLVLVVSAPNRIARATLTTIDAGGRERRIALRGVQAGSVPRPGHGDIPQELTPGLAVRAGVAYVASANSPAIVEVHVRSGRTVRHRLARSRLAKDAAEGGMRQLSFVGPHLLALAGTVYRAGGRAKSEGLRLLDVRTWRVRRVVGGTVSFQAIPGGGFVLSHGGSPPRGLTLFDAAGHRRASLLAHRAITRLQLARGYAYATTTEPRHRTWIVDLRTARIVRTLPTAQPETLLP